MSDSMKNVKLKALIDAKVTELHPQTNGEQIYLNEESTLIAKLAEIVAAINARDKIVDVNAKIKGAKDYTDEEIAKISGGTTGDGTNVLLEAKMYTDNKIAALINGAPSTLDTLKEITDAMSESEDIIHLLSESVGNKVDQSDYNAAVSSLALSVNGKVSKSEYDIDIANINSTLETKADADDIPTKTSQLVNDSGFKTTDNNTTYALSKSGSVIKLTGSDGSETTVVDVDTKYSHPIFNDIAGTYRKVTIDNEGHVTFGSNAPVTIAEGGTGATTAEAALAALGAAPSEHTHKYAGSATAGGPAAKLKLTRDAETTADANYMPSTLGSTEVREYSNAAANLPSPHWYDIIANQSPDSTYGTQLAIGLTTDQVHYRRYDNGTFGDWKQLLDSSNYTDFVGENTGGGVADTNIIGENLLPYPYYHTFPLVNRGITFDDYDGQGGIIANGVVDTTNQPYFMCELNTLVLKANKPYTFASNCTNEYGFAIMWFRKPDGSGDSVTMPYTEIRDGITSTANASYISELRNGILYNGVTIIPSQDVCVQLDVRFDTTAGTVTDAVFYPMLEVGSVAHNWQPYNLSRQGLVEQIIADNLIPYPYSETTNIENGISWGDNGDGTLSVSGTATGNSFFTISNVSNKIISKLTDGEIYTLSDGYGNTDCYIWVEFYDNSGNIVGTRYRTNKGAISFRLDKSVATQMTISAYVPNGKTLPNVKLKPMLEKGTMAHPYQPYNLSRHKLRSDIDTINNSIIGENLLPYPHTETTHTDNGITYTDNGDGSITMNGTATADSIFLLSPIYLKAGTYTLSVSDKGFDSNYCNFQLSNSKNNIWWGLKNVVNSTGVNTYTLDRDLLFNYNRLIVKKGHTMDNVTWKPMVEEGTVAHPYQPYNKSRDGIIEQIIADNLLPYPYYHGSSKTVNGITTTIDENGWAHVKGTASAAANCFDITYRNVEFPAGTYTISGIPEDASESTHRVWLGVYKSGTTTEIMSSKIYGDGKTITVNEPFTMIFRITVPANATVDVVYKPMLEKGTIAHPYQPYKLSRQSLRADIDSAGTGGSNVSVTQSLTSGTKVGTITVDGNSTVLYAPSYSVATTSANGLMSKEDKTKLEAIDAGANNYVHPSYTARTGVPTANQTPTFGGSFTVSQPISDATGHITSLTSRTVTIPSASATTSADGLMSSEDKSKLNMTNFAFATCTTDAATSAKVATIEGNENWTLEKGSIVVVKYANTNTASNVTLNVNNTGAKSIWYNSSVYTGNSNIIGGYAGRFTMFMYDGTNWIWLAYGSDANTTYTPATLGQGYGTCATAKDTSAKVVTLSSYALVTGGIVSVKFTYAVSAGATMNINSKGAKNIYYRGAAITDGIINAGDIATFIYNGSQYHLISIDKGIWNNTTKGSLGYNASTAQNLVPTVSTIAFWDGAYANTTSNLAYCKLGAFGAAAVKGVDTTPTSDSTNLVTSGGVYDALDVVKYGTCSTAAATVEKVVACDSFKLRTGAEITVRFTVTNTASNPTLNVNDTGAKPIYYRGTAITAGYLAANRTYTFSYNGTQYDLIGDLDTNNYDRIRYNGNIKCGTTAIVSGNVIVGKNGVYQHLKSGQSFDITYPILHAGSAIAASGTGSNNYKAIAATITTTQSITLTAYKPVYIKGKIAGTMFTPVSTTPLTQTVPTTEDGYQYILLGLAYSTNGVYIYPENSIFEYRYGVFGVYGGSFNGTNIYIADSKPSGITTHDFWFDTSAN